MKNGLRAAEPGRERGATLVFLGISLVAILGVMSLALDLGMLYVARNDAQRAADAAALAGAYSFTTSGCITVNNCVAGGPQEAPARQQAEAVGAKDLVLEQPAQIQDGDIAFSYPQTDEPQITVSVERATTRGNAVPTIFAKIFGTYLANVSATATAEAYNFTSAVSCVAPFLVPNCLYPGITGDPPSTLCSNYSPNGPAPYPKPGATQLIIPGKTANYSTAASGVVGQPWSLHFGLAPSNSAAPSQWYLIAFVNSSGSQIRNQITQCSPQPIACGDILNTADGKKVGPVDQGVEQRIHASGLGTNQGQDVLDDPSSPADKTALTIDVGSNNPLLQTPGNTMQAGDDYPGPSDSIMTVPVYDGHALSPGGDQVTVIGYLLMFLSSVDHNGGTDNVNAVILDVLPCNSNAPVATGGSVPIRLIRTGS